jgi:hypothetical protein
MVATFTNGKPRGRPFKKGQLKSAGRKVGAQNLYSRAVKWIISEAAHQVGGLDRLVAWIKESEVNERLFWTQIWPRLLPLQVQGTGARGELELTVKLTHEELLQRLRERGLPTSILGIDKPVLELEPRQIEGNGSSEPRNGNGSEQ